MKTIKDPYNQPYDPYNNKKMTPVSNITRGAPYWRTSPWEKGGICSDS